MAPLNNIRHEVFAQELTRSKSNVEAYQKAFPGSEYNASRTSSSRLLAQENIKARIIELMQENDGTSPANVVQALSDCIRSENEGVKLNAVNTALKAYHVFDEERQALSIDTVNIVFGDVNSPRENAPLEVVKVSTLSTESTGSENGPSQNSAGTFDANKSALTNNHIQNDNSQVTQK